MTTYTCSGPKPTLSRFALLAEADSDGEEEAVARSCSCSGLACIHALASPAAFELARTLMRPRFWLWPIDWDDHEQWPCCCSDPGHALDEENGKSVFSCSHGKWLMVNSAAEATPRDEELLWGDLVTIQEQIDYASLPASVRAAREAANALESKAMAAAAVEIDAHRARLAAESAASFAAASKEWEAEAASHGRGHRRNNAPAHAPAAAGAGTAPRVAGKRYDRKTNLPMPCRCHAHDGVPGNIAPASSGVNKKGEAFSYPAGCQQHEDFVARRTTVDCPFFHIGDTEWRIIIAAHKSAGGAWRT
jgi:hypothetical protein